MDRTLVRYCIMPPGATPISKSLEASGTTIIIHTVDSSKTLYLAAISWAVSASGAGAVSRMFVQDDGNNYKYDFFRVIPRAAGQVANSLSFPYLHKVLAGWDIVVTTDNVNSTCWGFIDGWEE